MQRHSSLRNRPDQAVLNQRLEGAVSYDRIAGYFRSSLFEVAGQALPTGLTAALTAAELADMVAYLQALK